jgi:HEAT repeat protein
LRGHPSAETEAFLLLAARDWDPTYRAAAIGSLGWWEPVDRHQLLACLHHSRRDLSPDVRHAARAALARLGERQAMQWFRQALCNEETQVVHETIQAVANEGLTLLWPDLDRLADAEDNDVAHHAREALERLCEDLDRRIKLR